MAHWSAKNCRVAAPAAQGWDPFEAFFFGHAARFLAGRGELVRLALSKRECEKAGAKAEYQARFRNYRFDLKTVNVAVAANALRDVDRQLSAIDNEGMGRMRVPLDQRVR